MTDRSTTSRPGPACCSTASSPRSTASSISIPPRRARSGDLEAYLHGFGHLLDLIRGTTEQAYADAFAERSTSTTSSPRPARRSIQTWLLPYLAELVGAELLAPDPAKRVDELNNAVGWYKTKGTLVNVDGVADVVSGAETVVVEGWRRVLMTPRLALPPFTAPAERHGRRRSARAPAASRSARPTCASATARSTTRRAPTRSTGSSATPRRRRAAASPSRRSASGSRARVRGVPCFPGAYDDTTLRTPDLRDPLCPRCRAAPAPHHDPRPPAATASSSRG